MESILTSIKKLLGIDDEYFHFDPDIVMYINSAFMSLTQIGVGPESGFVIEDKTSTWTDFIGERRDMAAVKTYVYLKTRMMFDPPQSGVLIDAIKTQLAEIEWRLHIQAEGGTT